MSDTPNWGKGTTTVRMKFRLDRIVAIRVRYTNKDTGTLTLPHKHAKAAPRTNNPRALFHMLTTISFKGVLSRHNLS